MSSKENIVRKNIVISLLLLTLVICSPYCLYLCSVEANGDGSAANGEEAPPTFKLVLEPAIPSTWPEWRPEYKKNALFVATIKGETATGQKITKFTNVQFTFKIVKPSQWKGVCMNFKGDTDVADSYDLFFRKKDNASGSGYTYTITHPIEVPGEKENVSGKPVEIGLGMMETGGDNSSVTVSVRINDYAAVGTLSASATFNYEDPRSGSSSSKGKASGKISIPLDNNGNDIADGWLDDHIHNYDPWADEETGPGNNAHTGDGLTVFEEYRGFMVQEEPKSTKPTEKDVFIYSEFETEGIGYTESALPAGLKAHQIQRDELYTPPDEDGVPWRPTDGFSNDNVLSINHQTCTDGHYKTLLQVVKQRALWVMDAPNLIPRIYGQTQGKSSAFPSAPHETNYIVINKDWINELDSLLIAKKSSSGFLWPHGIPEQPGARRSEMVKRTITHEIGHGIGLYHPFNPIPNGQPSGPRVRYHDRVTYLHDTNVCQHEIPPGPHNSERCGTTTPHKTWDSGTTVMDYGSEHAIETYMEINALTYDQAEYLADLERATQYHSPLHDKEYLFVMPSIHKVHQDKAKPTDENGNTQLRKNKPKWSPPNDDETNSNTETSSDTSTTDPPQPDAPTGISMTAGDGQIRLSWSPVSGTVTEYKYQYRENGGSWSSWISAKLATFVDVMNLVNGSTYQFNVIAMNGQVEGVVASTSLGVTPATVPGAPTSLSGERYNRGVKLSWNPPDDDGGADVTEYQYQYSYTYETYGDWTTVVGTDGRVSMDRRVSIGGLTNGRQYQFRVRAKNDEGYGAASQPIYKTPATTPSAPVDFTVTAGDSEVTLEWTAPYSNGGLIITDYEYSYREGSSGSWGTGTSAGTDLSATVTDLTNGTEYEFCVYAENSVGSGSWAGPSSATPHPPPVWSDIPDPYNLTVGDSFSLDLSSYVTGSPTITWTSGWIPAGLSFSNGVLSGTVTGVETRSLQFTATNTAGTANSEWVQIIVQAAQ